MKGFIIIFSFFAFHPIFSQSVTLRDTTNQYDYIIITVPEFVSVCEPFKQHKETVRDFRTLIVDTTQIYSEFDSSSTPQDNIRDFISYAGTFWEEPRPNYFLLVGNVNAVPNFLISYTQDFFNSDYYYGQSIYDADSITTEYYIGRIPAVNSEELINYFSKVIDYENNNTLESWMNNNLFICENDVQFGFLESAKSMAENFLPDFMRSYFIVNDTNSIYYGNKDSIYSSVNERGCSIIWFIGHHSDSVFISPDYFNIDDIQGFNNDSKFFLTIFIAPQHSILDTNTNLSKEMLVIQNAGSLGGSVFVGTSFWGVGKLFRNIWAQRIFDPSVQSIGEAFTLDNLVPPSGIYWYLKTVTNLWCDPSLKLKYDITVDVEDTQAEVPTDFKLYQNYPNPFNPSTKIKFVIPRSSFVNLKVYNVLGKEAATLVNEERSAGNYEVEFSGTDLPSGVYFYKLQAGSPSAGSGQSFVETKKMVLMK